MRLSRLVAFILATLVVDPDGLARADTWRAERMIVAEDKLDGTLVVDVARDRVLSILPPGDPFSYPVPRFHLFALPLVGRTEWAPVEVAGTPPRRPDEITTALDPGRDRVVLLGDFDPDKNGLEVVALELAGTPAWHPLTPAGTPPSVRSAPSVTFDPLGDRVLLFGGAIGSDPTNELWDLRFTPNLEWRRLDPSGFVAPRLAGAPMTFDAPRDRLVLVQPPRTTEFPPAPAQAWLLDTSTDPPAWDVVVPHGPQPSSTTFSTRAVRDSTRDLLVMGGGVTGPDFWGLRLSDLLWISFGPVATPKPAAALGTLLFDERRTRAIAFQNPVTAVDFRFLDPAITWREWRIPGAIPPSFPRLVGYDAAGLGAIQHQIEDTNRLVRWAGGWAYEPRHTIQFPKNTNPVAVAWDSRAGRELVFATTTTSSSMVVLGYDPDSVNALTPIPNANPGPPDRTNAAVAYDSTTGTTFLYGGLSGSNVVRDLWSFQIDASGTGHWGLLSNTGPAGQRASLAFDPLRNKLMMFGPATLQASSSALFSFNVATFTWTLVVPNQGPSPRVSAFLTYDSARDRMLLQGGQVSPLFNDGLTDVWEMSLANPTWTQLANGATRHDRPSFGFYDPNEDALVTIGDPLEILAFDFVPKVTLEAPNAIAGAPAGRVTVPLTVTNGLKHDAPCAYEVTATRAWPGLPRAGSFQLLTVPRTTLDLLVDVPDTAAAGPQDLRVVVRALDGSGAADSATVRIDVSALPAPLLACGGDVTWTPGVDAPLDYVVENGSPAAGPVTYRLTIDRSWPGLPIVGETELPGSGSALLALTVPVPDTAAVGAVVAHLVVAPKALPSGRVECFRHLHDPTTPALLSVIESSVAADGSKVTLRWWSASAAQASIRIERRREGSVFEPIGEVMGDPAGFVVFVDTAIPGAGRYGYRAGRINGDEVEWSPEFHVDVPAPTLAFTLGAAAVLRGALEVPFTAPNAGPVTLEVFDVRGRRVGARRIDTPAPGTNRVRIAGSSPSGVYFLRLSQGARQVTGRVILLPAPS